MLARNFAISGKPPIEHLDIFHLRHIEPTPPRNPTVTLSANLPRKQPKNSFLNSVVVRLNESLLVLVLKSNQLLALDRPAKEVVQSGIDRRSIQRLQYSLGRGLSDASTGAKLTFPKMKTPTTRPLGRARVTLVPV